MRIFIRCDKEGNILSTMKVEVMPEGIEHPYGDIKEGEKVIEVEPTPDLEKLQCHEISQQYTVAIRGKKLKKKEVE